MASHTMIFQSITRYKVEVSDDGTVIGDPKFLSGWTTQVNAPKKTKKVKVEMQSPTIDEEVLM